MNDYVQNGNVDNTFNSSVETVNPMVQNSGMMDSNTNSFPDNNTSMSNDVSVSQMDGNKPKKSSKKFIVIGLIVVGILLLGLGGLLGYKAYVNNPMSLYKGAINKLYNGVSDLLEELDEIEEFNLAEDSLLLDGDIKLSSNLPLDDYLKYTYDFKLGMDVKNDKFELAASMNENEQEILAAMIYVLNNVFYFDSEQLFDGPLFLTKEEGIFEDIDLNELSTEIDYKKVDKLARKMSDYLINALDEDLFKTKEATIKVDGKDQKITKVIYPLNQDSMYDLVKSILNDIKNDDEFIEIFAELSGVDKAELTSEINETELNKEDFEIEEECEFYLITKGFFVEVIGFGLEADGEVMTYVELKDVSDFKMDYDGFELSAITKNNVTNGKILAEGMEAITFVLETEENDKNSKFDLSISMGYEGAELELDIVGNSNSVNDKRFENSFDINLSVGVDGQTTEIGAKLNINVEIGAELTGIDTNLAVDFNTLTDTEMQQILVNFENAIKDTFIYDLLYGMNDLPDIGYDDDFDYDYDYDYDYGY